MNNKYVTAAIDYVNGSPHLGHALEKIYADVYSRHLRKNNRVFLLTGTDENSLKNVRSAEKEGMTVSDLVDRNASRFKSMQEALNLSYDDFIRTTEERHFLGAQKLWKACEKDIYKKTYRGLYCVGCEEYYKEEDLEDGCCPIHKTKLEVVEEDNFFFKLTDYQKQLEEIIENDTVKIIPETRKNEVLSFIKSGLQDFCISRSNERAKGWGISVPGDDTQKMWVWFDALSSYISVLGYANDEKNFEDFWQNGEACHFIGKDILRFHAIYWIAMLLSANLKLPDKILTHGFITVNNQKMSKSLGNVIDPIELASKYGADPIRYFLLSEFKPVGDGDFSYEKFENKYNADLSSGLGNLISRVLTLVEKKNLIGEKIVVSDDFKKVFDEAVVKCDNFLDNFEFNEGVSTIWELIKVLDKYIEETKPWQVEDKKELVEIFSKLVYGIRKIAEMLNPLLPKTSEKILSFLGEKEDEINSVNKENLFPRL